MVCRRMGLLDDAIREHLELKRLRGADPGAVAREEGEAFGPVRAGEPVDGADHGVAAGGAGLAEEDVRPAGGDLEQVSPAGETQAFSNVGQETAELDMRAVLGEHRDGDAYGAYGGGPTDDGRPGKPVEDVMEETPELLHDTPGQERLWFEQQAPRDFDFDR